MLDLLEADEDGGTFEEMLLVFPRFQLLLAFFRSKTDMLSNLSCFARQETFGRRYW